MGGLQEKDKNISKEKSMNQIRTRKLKTRKNVSRTRKLEKYVQAILFSSWVKDKIIHIQLWKGAIYWATTTKRSGIPQWTDPGTRPSGFSGTSPNSSFVALKKLHDFSVPQFSSL